MIDESYWRMREAVSYWSRSGLLLARVSCLKKVFLRNYILENDIEEDAGREFWHDGSYYKTNGRGILRILKNKGKKAGCYG